MNTLELKMYSMEMATKLGPEDFVQASEWAQAIFEWLMEEVVLPEDKKKADLHSIN